MEIDSISSVFLADGLDLQFISRSDWNHDIGLTENLTTMRTSPYQLWELDKLWQSISCKGEGQKIAILDTGIDGAHDELMAHIANENTDFVSFVDFEHGWQDLSGHGTHCAGIIAQVVPEAKLLIGKVVNVQGEYNDEALAKGIEWATLRGAKVISLSLGVREYHHNVTLAVFKAVLCGVSIVCAAANDGYSSHMSIAHPASLGNVICVGSHAIQGRPSPFSSVGREIDFLAPGEHIVSYLPLWMVPSSVDVRVLVILAVPLWPRHLLLHYPISSCKTLSSCFLLVSALSNVLMLNR